MGRFINCGAELLHDVDNLSIYQERVRKYASYLDADGKMKEDAAKFLADYNRDMDSYVQDAVASGKSIGEARVSFNSENYAR